MIPDTGHWLRMRIDDTAFLERYPQFAAALSRVVAFDDPQVTAMAVSRRGNGYSLHVNVEYFAKEGGAFFAGILQHELHHLALGHLDHPKFRASANPMAMEIAMEVSANEFIREALPDGALTCERLSSLGMRPLQSTLERYEILEKLGRSRARRLLGRTVDDHRPLGGWGVRQNANARGGTGATLHKILRTLKGRRKGHLGVGNEPGDLIEALLSASESPAWKQVDWRVALERFASRMREPSYSLQRPNRRFPERLGEVPGRTWSVQHAEPPRLLSAIDTSASMGSDELAGIAQQVRAMRPYASITIVECDKIIQRVYPFEGELECLAGRGGTDLCPVFARGFLKDHRPDGVVYFTDGQGPYPEDDPCVKTLWVLTKDAPFTCSWGQRVLLAGDGLAAGR